MSNDQQEDDMIIALTPEQRATLDAGLEALPDAPPPRIVWERIREQAEAEGLLKRSRNRWLPGAGIAAAVVVTLSGLLLMSEAPEPPSMTVPAQLPSNGRSLSALQALMVESRQLEADLNAIPAAPRVRNAGTVATIDGITDRIAAIDVQLNDPESTLSPADEEVFWRERVRLMKLLVGLRYAQSQRNAF